MSLRPEDELAIHRLLSSYAHTVSARDVEGWVDLFVDDAVWERAIPAKGAKYNEPAIHEGKDSIRELAESSFDAGVQYLAMNPVVDGDGDTATGLSTVVVLAAGESGDVTLVATGNFDDDYRRTEDGWKFVRRSIRLLG
jgi:ketosteroid isomerase-like protein